MVYKILCITLLACVLVQAAPKFDEFTRHLQDNRYIIHKFGDAGHQVLTEQHETIGDHFDSAVDAFKAFVHHARQSLETKKTLLTSPISFTKKVIDIIGNKDETQNVTEVATTESATEFPPLIIEVDTSV